VKALFIDEPGKTSIRDVAEPSPRRDEVLLEVRLAGFCGSDLSTFRGKNPLVTYPTNPLARQLRVVGAMIRDGMKTRVYYVSLGGFDTHANQLGQHGKLERLEGLPVAPEPGDGDPAQPVEHAPLHRVVGQPTAVGVEPGELERGDSARDPLADLSPHLAKAGPPHPQLGERPLQEANAVVVAHVVFIHLRRERRGVEVATALTCGVPGTTACRVSESMGV